MKRPRFLDRLANSLGYVKEVSIAPMSGNRVPVAGSYKQTDYLKAYSGWVYACVKARSQDFAQIKLHLYKVVDRKTGEVEEITDHNVLSLLRKVNPWMTRRQLFEYTQAYRDLAGEAFWYLVRGGRNGQGDIIQIWILRPDWVKVIPDSNVMIKGYEYMVPGHPPINFRTDEIIHFKEFNPLSVYRGMSVVGAAAVTIDSESFAEQYNRSFFENSAEPSAVLKTEQKLDQKLKDRMRTEWQNEYGGKNKSHRIAILEAGLELQPYSMSQRDMEFLNGQQYSRDKIMAIFQTPKTVLGMTEGVTVSNADATDYVFQKRVILPLMEKFCDDLNEFLIPLYSDLQDCFFDIESPVPQMIETDLKRYQTLFSLGAMTPNEIRAEQGLDEEPGLDTYYLPLNLVPVSSDSDGENPTVTDEQKAKRKTFKNLPPLHLKERIKRQIERSVMEDVSATVKAAYQALGVGMNVQKGAVDISSEIGKSSMTDDAQDAYWKGMVVKAESAEKRYEKAVRDIMTRQEKEVVDKLNKVRKAASSVAHKDSASDIQKILFSISTENKTSASILIPIISDLITDVGSDAMDLVGASQPINTTTEAVKAFLSDGAMLGIKAMNTTTRSALKTLLATSFAQGLSNDQTARKITEYFSGIGKSRADTIARTETLKASNFGTLEAYKQSGVVVGKQWYTAMDERVCPQCGPLQGLVIGLSQDFFDKGDTQMGTDGLTYSYGYESIGTPPLHPNCRCTIVPVTKR